MTLETLNNLWEIRAAASVVQVTLRLVPEEARRSAFPVDETLESYTRHGIRAHARRLATNGTHSETIQTLAEEADEAAQNHQWETLQATIEEILRYSADASISGMEAGGI